jgi:hypothetical protein
MVSSQRIEPLICSLGLDRLRDAQLLETLVAGGFALVHRQQTLVVGKHLSRGAHE